MRKFIIFTLIFTAFSIQAMHNKFLELPLKQYNHWLSMLDNRSYKTINAPDLAATSPIIDAFHAPSEMSWRQKAFVTFLISSAANLATERLLPKQEKVATTFGVISGVTGLSLILNAGYQICTFAVTTMFSKDD